MEKLAVLLTSCIVGCSGGGDDLGKTAAGDGGPMTSGSSGIQSYIDALCGLARTCCGEAAYPAGPLANCESDVTSQTHTLQGVVDGTVTVNGSVMATCAAAIQSVAGTCTFGTDITTKCENVFNGTVADGQPCRFADECKRGDGPVVCLKVSTSSVSSPETGVCHPLQRGASGSPCIFSASGNLAGATYTSPDPNPPLVFCHSDDGLSCSSPSRTCTPLAALGASCAGGGACAAGLYCDTTCRQKKSEGETCTGSGECADPFVCKSGSCAPTPVASDKLCGGDYN